MQDKLATLKDEIVDGIKEMLMSEIVEAGIKWIIGLLGGPAGAFVKACMAIYDLVMWFMDNASRLQGLIQGIISGVQALASGDVGALAKFVEEGLADAVPIAIGLFASLLGIGDLSTKIRKIIDKVRQPIEDAIKYVLDLIKGFVMKIAKMLGIGGKGGGGAGEGQIGKEVTFTAGEQKYTLDVEKSGELMLEGEDTSTLEAKLSEVAATNPKDEAQAQLSQAQTKEASASDAAKSLAGKMDAVKTMDDGPIIQQQQTDLEADMDSLGSILSALFKLTEVLELEDGEIGETQTFEGGEETHRLWIQVNDANEPTIMMASVPMPLESFLKKPEVQELLETEEGKAHIQAALQIHQDTSYDAQTVMDALENHDEPTAESTDAQIEGNIKELVTHLQWILNALNQELEGSLALYRGIHFKITWDQEAYRRQLKMDLVGEPTFSAAVRELAASEEPDGSDVPTEDKEAAAKLIIEEMDRTHDAEETVKAWWQSKKVFDTQFFAMLQRYVNSYERFHQEMLAGKMTGLTFTEIPFISTSKKPEHSAQYALGSDKILSDDEIREKGIIGRVFVYVFTIQELIDQKAADIQILDRPRTDGSKILAIKARTKHEGEVTFTGSIPGENRVGQIDVTQNDTVSGITGGAKGLAESNATEELLEW